MVLRSDRRDAVEHRANASQLRFSRVANDRYWHRGIRLRSVGWIDWKPRTVHNDIDSRCHWNHFQTLDQRRQNPRLGCFPYHRSERRHHPYRTFHHRAMARMTMLVAQEFEGSMGKMPLEWHPVVVDRLTRGAMLTRRGMGRCRCCDRWRCCLAVVITNEKLGRVWWCQDMAMANKFLFIALHLSMMNWFVFRLGHPRWSA